MRKRLGKIISIGLAITMLVGLTACGKNTTGSNVGENETSGKNMVNAELAKQYVYAEQTIDLSDVGDDIGIKQMEYRNGIIYAVGEIYHWDEANSQNELKLISMNPDGSNMQIKDIQFYMDGVLPEEEEPAEDTKTAVTEDADMDSEGSFYEYSGIGQLIMSEDKLFGIRDYYKEDYTDSDNPIVINENYVCCWDMDGTMLWESKMEPLQTDESWSYIQGMVSLADDGLALIIGGDKMELMEVSQEGVIGERKPLPDNAESLSYSSNIIAKEDGVISYTYWDQLEYDKVYMNTYDFASNTIGEPQLLPSNIITSGYNALMEGGDIADLIYSNSMGIFAVNYEDTEAKQLMSFINSDIATNNMSNLLVLDEATIVSCYYDEISGTQKIGIFTKVAPEDIKDKAVVILAANYMDYGLKNRIIEYNKTNSEYRIVVKDYSMYNTMDDYMAGYTRLNNDILSSGMPDILIVDNNMPIESYISKGLIADVDALIAADEELSKTEFLQNVFDAYRVNGKLYSIIPSFYVRTMIGKKALIGDRSSWTMQEMLDYAETLPEDTEIIGELTRDSFMYNVMVFCGSDFVDVSTGKCAFDSQEFIQMLEFAKNLPEYLDEQFYGEDYWMRYESQYREDRTVLMDCFISDMRDMNRNINGYFGEDISYVGFPTDSGNGSVLQSNYQYALSAKSDNQEGAWQFLRYYLTEEYQNESFYAIPVNKAAFMKRLEESKEKPYYFDENGEKVEYEESVYINGEEVILPSMTEEQINELATFIQSVDKKIYYNEDVQNIIGEEVAAFFKGQKEAAEVAGIIQSRVQIYVNENR